jgi:hypothetical protein
MINYQHVVVLQGKQNLQQSSAFEEQGGALLQPEPTLASMAHGGNRGSQRS